MSTATQNTTMSTDTTLPRAGVETTKELAETTSAGTNNSTGSELLAELCDETLTEVERFETQLALSEHWKLTDDLLETRVLGVYRDDPRNPTGETTANTDADAHGDGSGDSDTIYIAYWLPWEEIAVESFTKPVPWDTSTYKFAALVEAIGYGPTTIDQIEGELVVLLQTESGWETPDPNTEAIHPGAYT